MQRTISRRSLLLNASIAAGSSFACARPAISQPLPAQPVLNVPMGLAFTWEAVFAPLRWGEDKGIFKDAGLALNILTFQGGDQSMQLLTAGKIDYAFTDGDSFLAGVAAGKVEATAVYVWLDTPSPCVAAFEPLASPRAMVGKSFGTTATATGRWLIPYILKKNGVDPSSVSIDAVDFSVLYTGFLRGQFDTVQVGDPGSWQNLLVQARKLGKRLYLARLSDWGLVGYDKILIVRNAMLRSSLGDIKRVVKALDRARGLAVAHATDAEIYASMQGVMPQADEAPLVADWHDYKAASKKPGPIDPKVLAATVAGLVDAGYIAKSIPVNGVYRNVL